MHSRHSELNRVQKLQQNRRSSQFSPLHAIASIIIRNPQDDCRLESRWFDVCLVHMSPYRAQLLTFPLPNSYNRYLAVAAGAVRRSLKEGARLHAEARGRTDLLFAKWKVRTRP